MGVADKLKQVKPWMWGVGAAGVAVIIIVIVVPVVVIGQQQQQGSSGSWTDPLTNTNGEINWDWYRYVAENYNTKNITDWRFGPKYSNFHSESESFPTVYQPYPDGLVAVNTQHNWCRVEPGEDGDPGAGWITSGQMLFIPDESADGDFKYGCSNMRNSDGAISFTDDGLCMRIRSEWRADWWNRNAISVPGTPAVAQYANISNGQLAIPPVAIARGAGGASVTGFIAFKNGLIGAAGTGNDGYAAEDFNSLTAQLDANKYPTAMVVTNNNEFVFVTTWDPQERKGQIAVLAVKNRQNAQETRFYWGFPGWPIIRGVKLLGYIDLPFAAPLSIDVTVSTVLGNTRGFGTNVDTGDFSVQANRDLWFNRTWTDVNNDKWKQTAQSGYVIVASRAENKVAFVDLRPLLQYYRKMYLTTQENYDQTTNEGSAENQWPFSFKYAPEQVPVVVKVLDIEEPTAVSTGTWWNTPTVPRSESKHEQQLPLMTAYIASMDGTVRMYNVTSLIIPDAPANVPDQPWNTFQVGKNPTQIFHGFFSTANDDLQIVCRGDRSIYYVFYNGTITEVLRDSRIQDPVNVFVSINYAGYGGRGPGKAIYSFVMSVMDFDGKQVLAYMVNDLRNNNGESVNYTNPNTGEELKYMFGWANPTKGYPFMANADEVI